MSGRRQPSQACRFRAKRRLCVPRNERGRQLRRPYFLLAGLWKEACKIGYNILNPKILFFLVLRGNINFDAVVKYLRASGRRNFLGKNSHWLFLVTEEGNVSTETSVPIYADVPLSEQ